MSSVSISTATSVPVPAGPVQAPARDLLTGSEWNSAQVRELYHLAADIKARPERYRGALSGRFLALIFEKPSLRTRVTFEVGISSMGGAAVFLDHTQSRLGERESVPDVAKNLDRWVHAIVARVFEQGVLDALADNASIPVINALSDRFHPCQALADFFTLEEHFGGLRGLKFAYIGDGNNVCHSLITIGARVGAHVRVATPAGYEPDSAVVAEARRFARETRGKIEILRSPEDAVSGAQAVYTDVWASMGQESEASAREAVFAPFQVNESLFAQADPRAVFMHCLPAHRGSEVTEGVLDSPQSIVFDQAENRLHVQKAILLTLLG
ncbi:MAG TPA: ornithine carbamoyltransferase [Candidatus Acidoferrales bacterium]|nr:ornithine carbamoyltransferase [Candidatus Acidoferrales bacterium]